jgi:hypothetical protein
MRHPLTTVLALAGITSTLWLVTLAQLPGPSTYTSIPAHSTRTIWPGP